MIIIEYKKIYLIYRNKRIFIFIAGYRAHLRYGIFNILNNFYLLGSRFPACPKCAITYSCHQSIPGKLKLRVVGVAALAVVLTRS